jgi:hypothetical protein
MIAEQLAEHLATTISGWTLRYDFFRDTDPAVKQFIIRNTGGAIDGLNGNPSFDLIAIGDNPNASTPKQLLSDVSTYLLANPEFSDIINVVIVSGARPSGLLSNDRPVYTMTVRLITERSEEA